MKYRVLTKRLMKQCRKAQKLLQKGDADRIREAKENAIKAILELTDLFDITEEEKKDAKGRTIPEHPITKEDLEAKKVSELANLLYSLVKEMQI